MIGEGHLTSECAGVTARTPLTLDKCDRQGRIIAVNQHVSGHEVHLAVLNQLVCEGLVVFYESSGDCPGQYALKPDVRRIAHGYDPISVYDGFANLGFSDKGKIKIGSDGIPRRIV